MPVFCLLLNFPDNAFIGGVRKGTWKRAQSSARSGGNADVRLGLMAASFKKGKREKKKQGKKKVE